MLFGFKQPSVTELKTDARDTTDHVEPLNIYTFNAFVSETADCNENRSLD